MINFDVSPVYRGVLLLGKCPPPLGPPFGPRHRPTVGSQGGAVFYERGTSVGVPRRVPGGANLTYGDVSPGVPCAARILLISARDPRLLPHAPRQHLYF